MRLYAHLRRSSKLNFLGHDRRGANMNTRKEGLTNKNILFYKNVLNIIYLLFLYVLSIIYYYSLVNCIFFVSVHGAPCNARITLYILYTYLYVCVCVYVCREFFSFECRRCWIGWQRYITHTHTRVFCNSWFYNASLLSTYIVLGKVTK